MFGSRRNFSPKKRYNYQKMPGFNIRKVGKQGTWKIWLWVILIMISIPVIVGWAWFYKNILQDLPDIAEIENFNFKQATTITDRHGEVLYTLFEENRQYIPYEKISENFINALVATEDQRFRTNPGIDWKGTIRAGITDITQGKTHGASTITQQLIKNLMLTPEKKIERKLKEIVLAMKLNKYITNDIKKKYMNLSDQEIEQKMKEKILELYSNYIFLGNNSYGVEVASRNYFDKNAADLTILEWAILAGIPQAPSKYDPYNKRAWLMWEIIATDKNGTPVDITDDISHEIITKITASINNTNTMFRKDDTALINYLKWRLSFELPYQNEVYQIQYNPWRKDSVLARMYEEWYITESEFKQNFLAWFTYHFKRWKVQIKAPHFVFWVINMLEKNYDPELLRKWWLTITTTLDKTIQTFAEESINENKAHLDAYHVNNAAMIYTDSQNGDVLAYVWSEDYYNDDIDGQVDIIQAKRQPGSIIKPLIYALWFIKLNLTIDSPIYDIPFMIGNNRPHNADGIFQGLMAIKNALAGSRNIPAIKMFFAVGGETVVKEFLQKLGLKSLRDDVNYGYPLAIGAGEAPMIEMTNAYMHLSAMGKPAEINPIMEIRSSDGTLLGRKQVKTQDQVIPAWVAYLIWNILSDKSNFPWDRQSTFTYPWITFATKSGTTNVKKWKEKLPRDGWFVAYTPDHVMMFRWGNTDGSPLRKDAYGGWINSPIWKTFTKKLEEHGDIQNTSIPQREVSGVSISKISGKLASYETPLAFVKKSLGYIKTLPTQIDENIKKIKVDILCNGKPSELTPPTDIEDAYLIQPESILPDQRDKDDIIEWWEKDGLEKYKEETQKPLFIKEFTGDCQERYTIAELGEISLTIMQPKSGDTVSRKFSLWHQTRSPFTIKTMKLYLDDIELKSFNYNQTGNLIDISTVTIPPEIDAGTYNLKAVIFDDKWYSDSQTISITIADSDTTPPYFMDDKIKITPQEDGSYEVVLIFWDDASTIASGSITQGENQIYTIKNNVALFTVPDLEPLHYSVADSAGNIAEGTVVLKK